MKLEAIREDRTRGGRSTYQCSYTLPMLSPSLVDGTLLISNNRSKVSNQHDNMTGANNAANQQTIPTLLQVSLIYSGTERCNRSTIRNGPLEVVFHIDLNFEK